MIYLKRSNVIAVVLSAIVILASCKKDGDSHVPPVTEPLTVAAAKAGDTVIITGQNFSQVAAENTVEINGVAATVVSATSTEIKVVVPANATSGAITVTVYGNKVEAGSIVVSPLTIYAIKEDNNLTRQLLAISPVNGSESVILNVSDLAEQQMFGIVYQASTNEVLGFAGSNSNKLLKVNVTSKQTTSLNLTSTFNIEYAELVVGKNGELYGSKRDFNKTYTQSLVKIDAKTGDNADIKAFAIKSDWYGLVYLPASNEVAGIIDNGNAILKVNLTTKDTSTVVLNTLSDYEYTRLAVANGELYAFKNDYSNISNYKTYVVKLNATSGAATTVGTLSKYGNFNSNIIYLAQRKEFAGSWQEKNLFQYNVGTNANTFTLFPSSGTKDWYSSFANN